MAKRMRIASNLHMMISAGRFQKGLNKAFNRFTQNFSQEEKDNFWEKAVKAYEFGIEHAHEYDEAEEALFLDNLDVDFSNLWEAEDQLMEELLLEPDK